MVLSQFYVDEEIGFVSDSPKYLPQRPKMKELYLGTLSDLLEKDSNHEFIIGIGDNYLRNKIALAHPHLSYMNVISPSAVVDPSVQLGIGNYIAPGAIINIGSRIGNHNILNTKASLDHHNKIGDFTHVAPGCSLCGNVTLYDLVFLGAGCTVTPGITVRPLSMYKANSLIKSSTGILPMYEPYLDSYKESALQAIQTNWISNHGKFVQRSTNLLKTFSETEYCILMHNGTCATHCLLIAMKHCYPSIQKVYVSNNSYVAVYNMLLLVYPPEQVELMKMDEQTGNVLTSEDYIQSLEPNSAVMIVHNVGNIVNVPRLQRLRPDLVFIEDNCEGFGGTYEGRRSGSASFCSALSFYGNKTITTGEGGAFLTNNKEAYLYIKKIYSQGMSEKRYLHDTMGYNYRMTNVQAAFLHDQLKDIQHIFNLKKKVFQNYLEILSKFPMIFGSIKKEDNITPSYWMFTLSLPNPDLDFEKLCESCEERGFTIRPYFYPFHSHPHLPTLITKKEDQEEKHLSTEIQKRFIMLPSFPGITFQEQEFIIQNLASLL